MTPVRAPAIVRGDVPGLLRRGMPVRDDNGDPDVYSAAQDDAPELWTIDFTDPAALYLSLHWLAEKGHPMLWALPTTHGGRVEAWDGLTAWEVAAVLVSVSVGRVARGVGPVLGLFDAWKDRWDGEEDSGPMAMRRLIGGRGSRAGNTCDYLCEWASRSREENDVGALTDGCCLQVPGGLLIPE